MTLAQQNISPATQPPRRLYAIGDVHGRYDLLEKLLDMIAQDAEQGEDEYNALIFLGDYVDRGPNSKRVIERLTMPPPAGFEMICLKGNHEDMLLKFLSSDGPVVSWLKNGGRETLKSYGLNVKNLSVSRVTDADIDQARDDLCALMPAAHLDFLDSLELIHVEGDYAFVHAGVRPGVDLNEQKETDLVWIRGEFLKSKTDFGKIVVHGHSIANQPQINANRIGIDTGAWRTGVLTCLVIEGSRRRFLST